MTAENLNSKIKMGRREEEAAWPVGLSTELESHRSQVHIPFRPLADVILRSPEFNFSAMLVNSQLVCLVPVGILNLVMFI